MTHNPTASQSLPASANARRVKAAYGAKVSESEAVDWKRVEQYLPLVKSLVSRMRIYFPATVDVEDIYSIGVTGLVSATMHYDPQKNPAFGAYATLRVRGALLDELRRMDWMPRNDRVHVKKFRKDVEALEQRFGRTLKDDEIAQELGLKVREVAKLQQQRKPLTFVPLTATSTDQHQQESPLNDFLADVTQPDARDHIEKQELVEQLRLRLDKLPEMPKKVLAMYYLKGLRLSEIALAVGLTESRISQIHAQAITQLRQSLDRHLYSG